MFSSLFGHPLIISLTVSSLLLLAVGAIGLAEALDPSIKAKKDEGF